MSKLLNGSNQPVKVGEIVVEGGTELGISTQEVEIAINSLQIGKAAGKTGIQAELLKAMGKIGISWLTDIINEIRKCGNMPQDWKKGVIIPIYKGKGDILDCNAYRPIKLLEHTMKVFERILENRLRKIVKIDEMQRGFMPGRSTSDAMFAARVMISDRNLGWFECQK